MLCNPKAALSLHSQNPAAQIHDEDFQRLASGQLPDNSNALPRLLGVTNLYFLKSLPAWPNVLSSGKRTMVQRSTGEGALQGRAPLERRSRFGNAMKAVRRRAAGAQILMTEHVEQLWMTAYRCAHGCSLGCKPSPLLESRSLLTCLLASHEIINST